MTVGRETEGSPRPQSRNPAADPDTSAEKQSELKLNVGIGIIGTILSAACAVIFAALLGEPVSGIVMAVVAVVAAAVTAYVFVRLRRGRREAAEQQARRG